MQDSSTDPDKKCMFKKDKIGATAVGYTTIEATEEALMEALYRYGPISVNMNAEADGDGVKFSYLSPWFKVMMYGLKSTISCLR